MWLKSQIKNVLTENVLSPINMISGTKTRNKSLFHNSSQKIKEVRRTEFFTVWVGCTKIKSMLHRHIKWIVNRKLKY